MTTYTRRFLTEGQARELRAHLALELAPAELEHALAALDQAIGNYPGAAQMARELVGRQVKARDQLERVLDAAARLKKALDLPFRFAPARVHEAFAKQLQALEHSARAELDRICHKYTAGLDGTMRRSARRLRGAPPSAKRARAELIRTVYAAYPGGKARKRSGSHFEKTAAMALEFAGERKLLLESLHNIVTAALKTKP